MNFEKLMQNLDQVVSKLESGRLSLEDSFKEYETGVKTVREAQKKLKDMEGKIEKLMADGSVEELKIEN